MSELKARLTRSAQEALKYWNLDVAALELISRSENVVFKVTAKDGQAYALRIHRPGYNTLEELQAELIWTDALNASGIATPAHVRTHNGEGYAKVSLEGSPHTHAVGMIEWVPGMLLYERIRTASDSEVDSFFHKLGALIARLHDQTARWQPPAGFTRRVWDANGLVGLDPLWGRFWEAPVLKAEESTLLFEVRAQLHKTLTKLEQNPETFGLIHADLHPRNVMIDGESLQAIDFDDCGFGWHYYDIAVAFNEFTGHPRTNALQESLLKGYRSMRPLAHAEVALPAFFMVRPLVSLGWISARPELASSKDIRPRIAPIIAAAERYLAG